jgi:hypothetical protein
MIRYLDIYGTTHEKIYDKNIKQIILIYKNISQILEISNLSCLRKLQLSHNNITKITDIKGLSDLIELRCLMLDDNKIEEIKGLDDLISLDLLWLNDNKISEIKGLECLTKLRVLRLCDNPIEGIKGIDKLTNLTCLWIENTNINEIKGLEQLKKLKILWLRHNNLTEIKGLDQLNMLQNLLLCYNQITEMKGLERLSRLKTLQLSYNKISTIEGINGLSSLDRLLLDHNEIKKIPYTVMNLRLLRDFDIDLDIDPIIKRFLMQNQIRIKKTIFDDEQNVHNSSIVKSVKDSIYNIIDNHLIGTKIDQVLKEIVDDKTLNKRTKEQLVEYSQDLTVHSLLNLTFGEVLCSVWKIILEHKESDEIKNILNQEMKDSLCKCFTGRLTRLINCLNGFDQRILIKIDDKEQILNVIISIRNKYADDLDKQKEEVIKELTDRGYDKATIDEYIVYLE